MEFPLKVLVAGIIVLVMVFIILVVLSNLTGEGVNVMEGLVKFFQDFATAFSG